MRWRGRGKVVQKGRGRIEVCCPKQHECLGKPGVGCWKERPAGRTAWGRAMDSAGDPLRDVGARAEALRRKGAEVRRTDLRDPKACADSHRGPLPTQKRGQSPKPLE